MRHAVSQGLPLGGVFEGHTDCHLLAEVVGSATREDECLVFTGTHCLEVRDTATH